MKRHASAIAAALCATLLATTATAAKDSTYSTFDYQSCPEAASPEPGIIEVRRCEGPEGLAVYWHAEPDVSQIVIGENSQTLDFQGSLLFEVNNAVEWRWTQPGSQWPQAAIIRYSFGMSVSSLNHRRLAVYKIEPDGYSCIRALIDGENANERAREAADVEADAQECLR